MPDDVFRIPRLPKAFAPRREWNVAISDGPAERLGEDARIMVQIGRFRPRQIVDCPICGVGSSRITATARATSIAEIGEVLPPPIGSANSSEARTPAAAS